jgi:hypothetical protein
MTFERFPGSTDTGISAPIAIDEAVVRVSDMRRAVR